jgi:hypothetical protein
MDAMKSKFPSPTSPNGPPIAIGMTGSLIGHGIGGHIATSTVGHGTTITTGGVDTRVPSPSGSGHPAGVAAVNEAWNAHPNTPTTHANTSPMMNAPMIHPKHQHHHQHHHASGITPSSSFASGAPLASGGHHLNRASSFGGHGTLMKPRPVYSYNISPMPYLS